VCLAYYNYIGEAMGVIKKLLGRLLKEDPEIKKFMESCGNVYSFTSSRKHPLAIIIHALGEVLAWILANHPQSPLRELDEKNIKNLLMSTERFFGRQPDEKEIDEIARILANIPQSPLIQPDEGVIEEFLAEILGNRPRRKPDEENDEENTSSIYDAIFYNSS